MGEESSDYLQQMQAGTVATNHEYPCPHCGGTAHLQAGTLSSRPADWLWMEEWCEDCGKVEKLDGVRPWSGYELLLQTDAQRFTLAENRQRIKRFAAKGCRIQAMRLYRTLYEVDFGQAKEGFEQLLLEE